MNQHENETQPTSMNSLATNSDAMPAAKAADHGAPAKGASVVRQCAALVVAMAALWAVLCYPASRVAGARGVEGLTYAAVLCTVPGCMALVITHLFVSVGSFASHGAMLSTGLRLLVVGVAAVMLQQARPDLRFWHFHVWLITFYLAALAFETSFILKGVPRHSQSHRHDR